MTVPSADAVHDVAVVIARHGAEPLTIERIAQLSGYAPETSRRAVLWLLDRGAVSRARVRTTYFYRLVIWPIT